MELKERIVNLLMEEKPLRPGDIVSKLDANKEDVSKAIKDLKKENRIYSPKQCFYSVEK